MCIRDRLSACAPPFIIFIIGTGKINSLLSAIYEKKYWDAWLDKLLAKARLAARVAFAPILDLFSVPSKDNIWSSNAL